MDFQTLFDDTERILNPFGFQIVAGPFKGFNLYNLALFASQFPGEMAEVGVYAGGTARILAKAVPHKTLYAYDTFTGITKINRHHDRPHFKDAFKSKNLEKAARTALADCANVEIIKGWFPNTFKHVETGFCFVHADADVYPSTLAICETFWPRMVPGGIIVFDDYGYEDTPGAKKAVDEFFKDQYETPSVLTGGQAVVMKSDDYWEK